MAVTAAIAGVVIAAGGAAASAQHEHVAAGQAKHAEQKQENMMAQQRQDLLDENSREEAAKTGAVNSARQRAIQAVSQPSNYGGTLGTGAGSSQNNGPYGGASLLGV